MADEAIIYTGGGRIVASGTLIAFNDSADIRFVLGQPGQAVEIELRFGSDDWGPRIKVDPISERKIRLTLNHYGNPTGEGTTTPLKLGMLRGLQLYVNFRVVAPGGKVPRTVHYTFYLRNDEQIARATARGQSEALRDLEPSDE